MKPIPKSTTDKWRRMSTRGVPLNPAQAIRLLDFLEETVRELAMAEETIEKYNHLLGEAKQREAV